MRTRRSNVAPRSRSLGMSLVEVLVSTVIFAVGILGLLSANATAFTTFSDAKYRVDAALLADRLLGEIWVDRANVALYSHAGGPNSYNRVAPWLAEVVQTLPAADATVTVVGTEVSVAVSWQPPSAQRRQHVAVATLQEP
ncbi:MAG: type IV pilus modification PilV family protein [Burkholderiaceae bacterium]